MTADQKCPECGGVFMEQLGHYLHLSDCVVGMIKNYQGVIMSTEWQKYKLKKCYTQDEAIQYNGSEESAFKLAHNHLWNLSYENQPVNEFNVRRGWLIFVTNKDQPYSMKLFAGDWLVKDCNGHYSTVANLDFRKRYMQDGD